MFLRIFRNTRKQSLDPERVRQYVTYAMGEIVLVVVGILIALQINDWNENRKDRQLERTLIAEVRNALGSDLRLLDLLTDRVSVKRAAITRLLAVIESPELLDDNELADRLNEAMFGFQLSINFGPYEAIKSIGLDKISSNETRQALVSFYDFISVRELGIFEAERTNYNLARQQYDNMLLPYTTLELSDDGNPESVLSANIRSLLIDEDLYARLIIETERVDQFARRLNGLKGIMNSTLSRIESYLGEI